MRAIVLLFSLLLPFSATAQTLREYKAGALAVLQAAEKGKDSLDRTQTEDLLKFSSINKGFLAAVVYSPVMFGKEPKRGNPVPDAWMWEPERAASSFLDFMRKHEPAAYDDARPEKVQLNAAVYAWYLDSHSGKRASDQIFLNLMLRSVFGGKAQPLEIEIHGRKIRLVMPKEMVRLDGRMESFDAMQARLAQGGNYRLCAFMGTNENAKKMDESVLPSVPRGISIRQMLAAPESYTPESFATLCREIEALVSGPPADVADAHTRITAAGGAAFSALTEKEVSIQSGKPRVDRPFLKDDSAYCYSSLATMKVEVDGEEKLHTQASSVALMLVGDQLVKVLVYSKHEKPADLEWTQEICRQIVEETRELQAEQSAASPKTD